MDVVFLSVKSIMDVVFIYHGCSFLKRLNLCKHRSINPLQRLSFELISI